ncbi:MAG: hypothetical protein AAFP22_07745 [Planctomycetota bacterium]
MAQTILRTIAPLAVLLLAACAAPGDAAVGDPSPGPATALPPATEGMAPTPYTWEQIRWSHPVGASVTYRNESAGSEPVFARMTWVESSDEGCAIASAAGPGLETLPPVEGAAPQAWAQLRDHAQFPAGATTVTREARETPAGAFDCWKYVVESGPDATTTFWFATESAGSPVDVVVTTSGEETSRMLLVESTRRAL